MDFYPAFFHPYKFIRNQAQTTSITACISTDIMLWFVMALDIKPETKILAFLAIFQRFDFLHFESFSKSLSTYISHLLLPLEIGHSRLLTYSSNFSLIGSGTFDAVNRKPIFHFLSFFCKFYHWLEEQLHPIRHNTQPN